MSYRELRNLTEIMRALGYPRPISVDNFRTPNFELVSDLLYWMVKKYDSSSSVTDDIDTENDRIEFITQATSAVLLKSRIRLNPRRLYAADGFAVKELLKLAQVLYRASRMDSTQSNSAFDDDNASITSMIGSTIKDPKATRELSKGIMQSGAKLYDLLQTELQVRDARKQALRFLDAIGNSTGDSREQRHLERSLNEILQTTQESTETSERQLVELEAEEKALNAKIKKAQADLERSEKRLRSLQNVRPAFMDEYEKLERELERQYALYCERFRNLDYLQRELDSHHAHEMKKLAESDRSLKKLQKKFRDDELAILRGEQEDPLESSFADNNNSPSLEGHGLLDRNNGEQGADLRGSGISSKRSALRSQSGQSRKEDRKKQQAEAARRDRQSSRDEDDGTDTDAHSGHEDEDHGSMDDESNEAGNSADTISDSEEVSLADSADLGEKNLDSGSDENFDDSQSGSSQSLSGSSDNSDQDF